MLNVKKFVEMVHSLRGLGFKVRASRAWGIFTSPRMPKSMRLGFNDNYTEDRILHAKIQSDIPMNIFQSMEKYADSQVDEE